MSETRKLAAILVSDVVEESDGDLMGDGRQYRRTPAAPTPQKRRFGPGTSVLHADDRQTALRAFYSDM